MKGCIYNNEKGCTALLSPSASAELRAHGAHGLSVVAVVVVPVPIARIEVQVVRVVVVVRIERTGPVVAVAARVVEVVVPAVARGRKEDARVFGDHLLRIGGKSIGRWAIQHHSLFHRGG